MNQSNAVLFGVGIKGLGPYKTVESGKPTPTYNAWRNMLIRCYDQNYQNKLPSYSECTVSDQWLNFQNFAHWFTPRYFECSCLDKDLLIQGNKLYSPETCLIVHVKVNSFITNRKRKRGDYKIGCHWNRKANKFQAQINNPITSKREHLGYFDDEDVAFKSWLNRKKELAIELSNSEYVNDETVKRCLINFNYEDLS